MSAFKRFRDSMNIGYEQWHDGIGYDLEAIDALNESERQSVETILTPRAESDWRDLEALERLGTPRALEAIRQARYSHKPEIRIHAMRYGPAPSEADWEQAILYGLATMRSYSDGLVFVFDASVDHPTPAVRQGLWDYILAGHAEGGYHAGEALCRIAGVEERRELLLRIQGNPSPARDAVIDELRKHLGQ